MLKILLNKIQWRLKGKHKRPYTFNNGERKNEYFGKEILTSARGNELIFHRLAEAKPLMVSRLGATELRYLYYFLMQRYQNENIVWKIENKEAITLESGFFPVSDGDLTNFCRLYLQHLHNIDILGVWFKPGEDYIVKKYCKKASLVPLRSLEPYFHSIPWSKYLKEKKVLVIHPFQKSIEAQFLKREKLFSNQFILPDFKLITFKSIQSMAPESVPFNSWFGALEWMKSEIEKIDFDISIVGAGAYGLPLASFIKDMGKQAIHMGGATQLLFGIRGNRWDRMPNFHHLFNEHWAWPKSEEKPPGNYLVDDFAYWKINDI